MAVVRKSIDIRLTEEELRFVEWLAKRDNNTSVGSQIRSMFYDQLEHEKYLYLEEFRDDNIN